ncbi:Chloride channel protein 2 [Lamellibrachia satsuma]|nr:Chloride channel protein 2 [Lamellibrachia satsuma]
MLLNISVFDCSIACGFAGALFVYTHRKFVTFIRSQKRLKAFLQKNRFIFPASVMCLISTVNYPAGLGQFNAGRLTNSEALNELFTNVTWSDASAYLNVNEKEILMRWAGPTNNVFLTLICFIVIRFIGAAMATALPVPSGVFMPVFTIGAAFGRLMGECIAVWFPRGIGGQTIVPGGYAIVGAAALSGSVTHTISTAVIVFELTGQMAHILPCVISVMIANAVAASLQPSFYDMIIQIKRLPYLPETLLNTKLFINKVSQQDSEVSQQDSEVSQQDSKVSQQDSEVSQQDSEVRQQDSKVSQQDSEVSQQDSEVSQQDSEVSQQDSEVSQQDSKVSQQASEVRQQDSKVSQQASEVSQQDSEVSQQDSEVSQQDSEVSQQDSEVSQQDSEVSQQDSKVSQQASEVRQQDSKVSQQASEVSQQDSEVSQQDSEVSQQAVSTKSSS